jgi:hypothetical protein
MDAIGRTFTHSVTGEQIEIELRHEAPFFRLRVLRNVYGEMIGESGLMSRASIAKTLELLLRKVSIEVPVSHRSMWDGHQALSGHGADTVTVDADDPYLRTWFFEMLQRLQESSA